MDPSSQTLQFVPVLEITQPVTRAMVFSEGATVFGRLQLLRKLGEGRCSTVWLANDPRFRRQIALKVFRTDAHEATEEERRLWRELLRRQRIINHRNMILPLEFYSEMGLIALAGAFVDGSTLAQLLRESPNQRFEFASAEKWLQQIGLAMASAHSAAKIIHGNLNAFNVMVNANSDAKIGDFGFHPPISAIPEDSLKADVDMKLACLSPERIEGRPPSFAADIYAFGALAFQLLTGRNPAGVTPEDIRANGEALKAIDGLPEIWRRHILASLSAKPAERPVSFAALMHDLAPEELQTQLDPHKASREEASKSRRQRIIMARGSRRRRARNALTIKVMLVICVIALGIIIYQLTTTQADTEARLTADKVNADKLETARREAKDAREREMAFQLALEKATGGGLNSPIPDATPVPKKEPAINSSARKFFDMAQSAFAKGDMESAMINYDLAVVLQPDWPELLEKRGFARLKAKKTEDAINDFNKALSLDSSRLSALIGRGQASQALDDLAGARRDFEAALKIKPDSKEAKDALEALKP